MNNFLYVSLIALILFMAMILNLAAKPRFTKKLNSIFIVIVGVFALLTYGYGYISSNEDSLPVAVVRTLLAVCGIYVGKEEYDVVKNTAFFSNEYAKLGFWTIHVMALYATASTAITAIGSQALQRLRLLVARWGELNLIYGVNADSLEFGKSLMSESKCSVVYIDGKSASGHYAAISKEGCVWRTDNSAVSGDVQFLKSIGLRRGKRKVTLYALGKDAVENLNYARAFLDSLKKRGIRPEQTTLVIFGREDTAVKELQVLGEKYGYGYVTVFQEAGLAARVLIQNNPPCNCISFDEDGKATEDFEVLQVGFGRMGQAALLQLVMNGQFRGSTFRAAVFAPDCDCQIGCFANQYAPVLANYDISFHPYDARSKHMYDYILHRRGKIKYVVLCTGSDKMNREVAENLTEFFTQLQLRLPIHQCTYSEIITSESGVVKQEKLYQKKVLFMGGVDRMAMLLNHYYTGETTKTSLQTWMECDYFNRMSSRAAADFSGAMLRCAGKTREQAVSGDWNLTDNQLENLSRTEHLRWCAFHYCMGFWPMSEEEYNSRAEIYMQQIQSEGKASIRITRNMQQRTHACLIDWDALDVLSEKESMILGKQVNYKAKDTENVLAVPKILKLDTNESGGLPPK